MSRPVFRIDGKLSRNQREPNRWSKHHFGHRGEWRINITRCSALGPFLASNQFRAALSLAALTLGLLVNQLARGDRDGRSRGLNVSHASPTMGGRSH